MGANEEICILKHNVIETAKEYNIKSEEKT